jgi:hypothetical protein
MPEHTVSRRTFLAATGLGTAALLCAANGVISRSPNAPPVVTPNASPFETGPYQTSRVILGEDAGTTAMPQPFQTDGFPARVLAAVYYPNNERDHRPVPTPNLLQMASGPFPILLYAHAARSFSESYSPPPADRDFTSVEIMLRHVASYGCICVVPDLNWLPDAETIAVSFDQRAVVLVNYYSYLASLSLYSSRSVADVRTALYAGRHGMDRIGAWRGPVRCAAPNPC